MRFLILLGGLLTTSGCAGVLKDIHTERAFDECEETYKNAHEVMACKDREREARRQRDTQDANQADRDRL